MGIDLKNIAPPTSPPTKKESVTDKIMEVLNRDISFRTSFPDKKKERFYAEMSLLLTAGTDIKTALELIVDETIIEKDRKLLQAIMNDIVNGSSFSEALKKTGKFTEYEFYSLKVGEESANVETVLTDLADFYKRKIDQKKALSSTLSYPIVLLISAFGMVIFLLKFLVPMFQDIFKSFNKELPYITQLVIDLSETISGYFPILLVLFLVLGILIVTQRKKATFRKYTAAIILRLPIIGDMVQKIYLSRFCHSMHLLTSAKNPLLSAIQLVKKMVDFYPIQNALNSVEQDLLHGKLLNESMRSFKIFPKKMTSLIKVAEEVNKLEAIFKNLDEQYSKELEYQTAIFGKLLEPLLIVFISVVVGFIVVAMYLPMIEINTGLF